MTKTEELPEVTEDEIELEEDEATEPMFTAHDLAVRCGVSDKDFRRWLRSITPQRANKGGRWAFNAETADTLVARFATRKAEKTTEVELDADAPAE